MTTRSAHPCQGYPDAAECAQRGCELHHPDGSDRIDEDEATYFEWLITNEPAELPIPRPRQPLPAIDRPLCGCAPAADDITTACSDTVCAEHQGQHEADCPTCAAATARCNERED